MFQSTPPREGRRLAKFARSKQGMFQSTPPREGRPIKSKNEFYKFEFQSTPPREGRHAVSYPKMESVLVSIHAPTRGATEGILTIYPR